MAYLLEWNSRIQGDGRSLVRQVRVFRNANGMKGFIRTRAFKKIAGNELRVELRSRRNTVDAVITSPEKVLCWDHHQQRLPDALQQSEWERELSALTVRGDLVERWKVELHAAERLGLLCLDHVATLLAALEIFLNETKTKTR